MRVSWIRVIDKRSYSDWPSRRRDCRNLTTRLLKFNFQARFDVLFLNGDILDSGYSDNCARDALQSKLNALVTFDVEVSIGFNLNTGS